MFIKLYESWYDYEKNQARPIKELILIFENEGNEKTNACCDDGLEHLKTMALL